MKKVIFIFFLLSFTLLLSSCIHTCTCENSNGIITEIDVDISDNCSAHSGESLGNCS
jgi:hypothetical protein